MLEEILKAHPEAEFVQLQINYADWESPSVLSRANYEVARRYGKQIVIMEPVKGGALAKPDEEIEKLMKEKNPDLSPASWAIRFAAGLDGVLAVLSGMSSLEQMKDNLSYMKDFRPLDEGELEVLRKIQTILGASKAIPCTASLEKVAPGKMLPSGQQPKMVPNLWTLFHLCLLQGKFLSVQMRAGLSPSLRHPRSPSRPSHIWCLAGCTSTPRRFVESIC